MILLTMRANAWEWIAGNVQVISLDLVRSKRDVLSEIECEICDFGMIRWKKSKDILVRVLKHIFDSSNFYLLSIFW